MVVTSGATSGQMRGVAEQRKMDISKRIQYVVYVRLIKHKQEMHRR